MIILLLYVDDLLVAGSNKDQIQTLKAQLASEFDMKDLRLTNIILEMQIHRAKNINEDLAFKKKTTLTRSCSRFNKQDC